MAKHAISPKRNEDYPQWYQQVIKSGDLAETSAVRGCMVIKPWGWGLWENIKREVDIRLKATGHENAYFPLFIPVSFLEKEAEHVEGFAKECAVVTHHRLELVDGKLEPRGELEEPLVVRPTSETIIGESYSKWVQSYRDLPLLLNQWANVVRWEMRPRMFLRTAEFLWQEGHTVHATSEEAQQEVHAMAEVYREVMEDLLALPVIVGEKSEGERFPGAVNTITLEAMMQDGKALQAGTSHFLGQNFAKASQIKFLDRDGELKYAYTTSWGISTRLIGGMIMTHSDDDGLRIPPRIAPKHLVILPVIPKEELRNEVLNYAKKLASELQGLDYHGVPVEIHIDERDIRGGEKTWQWIKKGIPLRIEIGPRDIEKQAVMLSRRDREHKAKESVAVTEVRDLICGLLDEIQQSYFSQASTYRDSHMNTSVSSYEEFKAYFSTKKQGDAICGSGFVKAKWCEDEEASKELLSELKVTVRCLPLEQSNTEGVCILTGRPATRDAIFARAY